MNTSDIIGVVPDGVIATPWANNPKCLMVDITASLIGVRFAQQVLSSRSTAKSLSNTALVQSFMLQKSNFGEPPPCQIIKAPSNSKMVVLVANRPVRTVLVRECGRLDLGMQTMFVLTDSFVSLEVSNTEAAETEVNLVLV